MASELGPEPSGGKRRADERDGRPGGVGVQLSGVQFPHSLTPLEHATQVGYAACSLPEPEATLSLEPSTVTLPEWMDEGTCLPLCKEGLPWETPSFPMA